jgi:ATP synthase protein I
MLQNVHFFYRRGHFSRPDAVSYLGFVLSFVEIERLRSADHIPRAVFMKTGKDISTMQMVSEAMRTMLPYTHLGWQLIATILVFFGIGYWLDRWLGSAPWLMAILSFLGVVFAMVSFIRQVSSDSSFHKK